MSLDLPVPGGYYLDTIRDSDEDALVEHLQDPRISRSTLTIPYPYTREHARTFIRAQQEENGAHPRPVMFVIRDGGDRLVGAVGLKTKEGPAAHRAEVGYWVAGPCQGKGVATAALRCLSRYAFETLKLRRLVAHVYLDNPASARVLEKSGYQREGMLRQHFLKDDRPRDVIAYGLLPGELVP